VTVDASRPLACRSARSARRVIPRERLALRQKVALAVEILAVYVSVCWRLRRRDIVDLVAANGARSGEWTPDCADTWRVALRLAAAMRRTLRVVPTNKRCLVQSVVLSSLLSARGISSRLVIGAHSRPQFAAHAWVEHQGQPVLPRYDFGDSRLLEL
jgi:hypothetical protein